MLSDFLFTNNFHRLQSCHSCEGGKKLNVFEIGASTRVMRSKDRMNLLIIFEGLSIYQQGLLIPYLGILVEL